MSIDLLLYNGNIQCLDKANTKVSWLAAKNGKIFDMGNGLSYKKYLDSANEIRNLDGRTVFPGFYDNHFNLVFSGIFDYAVDLRHIESLDELFEAIRKKVYNSKAGETIVCVNFNENQIEEKRYPTRKELDVYSPENPVVINSISYHACSVNSLMFRQLKIPHTLEGIEKDYDGSPNGILTKRASLFSRTGLSANLDDAYREKVVSLVTEQAIRHGITTIVDFEGGYISHEKNAKFVLQNKHKFPLDIKLFYQSSSLQKALDHDCHQVAGLFLDGSFTGRSAAISLPYTDTGDCGNLFYTDDEINEYVLAAHKKNLQLTAHCDGDRAVEQLLRAYELAQDIHYRKDPRFRIEHCELISDASIQKAAELNVILSMQPAFESIWGERGALYDTILGELSRKTNRFKAILDAGITMVFGSDHSVAPLDPLLGIHYAVNHPKEENRISLEDAIKAYTINGAFAVFEETEKGSLEIGKKCDVVVLNDNPFDINPQNIKNLVTLMTIKEGVILYER